MLGFNVKVESNAVKAAKREGVRTAQKKSVGKPLVEGAAVEARVTRHARDRKITVYKYKRRKTHQKKQGHRQPFTEAVVESIQVPSA